MLSFILGIPKNTAKLIIRAYQKTLSTDHSFWARPDKFRICIHYPSCSEYTHQAIDKHGLVKGTLMGGARISRCNGFAKGGFEPVPDKFSLKPNYKDPHE
ncbi:MAG: membrane protein insertion efficiency factor YidD [Candidatus Dojkabacteria bacterium]